MALMSKFAGEQAEIAQKNWVEMNQSAFIIGMVLGLWCLYFLVFVNLSGV
jgi:hypothetical protein